VGQATTPPYLPDGAGGNSHRWVEQCSGACCLPSLTGITSPFLDAGTRAGGLPAATYHAAAIIGGRRTAIPALCTALPLGALVPGRAGYRRLPGRARTGAGRDTADGLPGLTTSRRYHAVSGRNRTNGGRNKLSRPTWRRAEDRTEGQRLRGRA